MLVYPSPHFVLIQPLHTFHWFNLDPQQAPNTHLWLVPSHFQLASPSSSFSWSLSLGIVAHNFLCNIASLRSSLFPSFRWFFSLQCPLTLLLQLTSLCTPLCMTHLSSLPLARIQPIIINVHIKMKPSTGIHGSSAVVTAHCLGIIFIYGVHQ